MSKEEVGDKEEKKEKLDTASAIREGKKIRERWNEERRKDWHFRREPGEQL